MVKGSCEKHCAAVLVFLIAANPHAFVEPREVRAESKLAMAAAEVISLIKEEGLSAEFASYITKLSPLFLDKVNDAAKLIDSIGFIYKTVNASIPRVRSWISAIARALRGQKPAPIPAATSRARFSEYGVFPPPSDALSSNTIDYAIVESCLEETQADAHDSVLKLEAVSDNERAPGRVALRIRLQEQARQAIEALDVNAAPEDKIIRQVGFIADMAEQRTEVDLAAHASVERLQSAQRLQSNAIRMTSRGRLGCSRMTSKDKRSVPRLPREAQPDHLASNSDLEATEAPDEQQAALNALRTESESELEKLNSDVETAFNEVGRFVSLAKQHGVGQLTASMETTTHSPQDQTDVKTAAALSKRASEAEALMKTIEKAFRKQTEQLKTQFTAAGWDLQEAIRNVKQAVATMRSRLEALVSPSLLEGLFEANVAGRKCYDKLVNLVSDAENAPSLLFSWNILDDGKRRGRVRSLLASLSDKSEGTVACFEKFRLYYIDKGDREGEQIFNEFKQIFENQFGASASDDPQRKDQWTKPEALQFLQGADALETLIILQASQLLLFDSLRTGLKALNDSIVQYGPDDSSYILYSPDALSPETAFPKEPAKSSSVKEEQQAETSLAKQIAVSKEVDEQFMKTFKLCVMDLHMKEAADKLRIVCNKKPVDRSVTKICDSDVSYSGRPKREDDEANIACLPASYYYLGTLCVFNCLMDDVEESQRRFPPLVCGPNGVWNYQPTADQVRECSMEASGLAEGAHTEKKNCVHYKNGQMTTFTTTLYVLID